MRRFAQVGQRASPARSGFRGAGPWLSLTPREAEVLELLAEGLTTASIAARMYVSPQAVTYHVGNLLAKLQSDNRTGLVSRAFVAGLLDAANWPPKLARRQGIVPRSSKISDLGERFGLERTYTEM